MHAALFGHVSTLLSRIAKKLIIVAIMRRDIDLHQSPEFG
jgi:hypothetical protein